MKYTLCFVIVVAMGAITGCEPSQPDELIEEETYERMFIEFAIINQLDQQLLKDTSKEDLRETVYQHYGVTEREFRISHEYYEMQIEQQVDRIKDITKILREERDSLLTIERKYNELTTPEQIDSLRQSLLNKE